MSALDPKSAKTIPSQSLNFLGKFGLLIFVLVLFLIQLLGTSWDDNLKSVGDQVLTTPNEISTKIAIAEMSLSTGDTQSFDLVARAVRMDLERNKDKMGNMEFNKYISQLNSLMSKRGANSNAEIVKSIDRWEKFSENWSDFRDAYLKLAILYHRIRNDDLSFQKFQKALELDPNSDKVAEVKKALNY